MQVTIHLESDDVLESLHKGLEADSVLVQTLVWSNVTDDDGEALIFFDLKELAFNPVEDVSWVKSFGKQVIVPKVANLRVD